MELLDNIVLTLKDTLNGSELNHSQLLILTITGMEIVQGLHLPAPQKKDIVLQSIGRMIDKASLSDDARDQLEDIKFNMLGPIIDSIISAANGQYKLKRHPKGTIKKTVHKFFRSSHENV